MQIVPIKVSRALQRVYHEIDIHPIFLNFNTGFENWHCFPRKMDKVKNFGSLSENTSPRLVSKLVTDLVSF